MCEYCEGNKLLFQVGDDDFDHLYIGLYKDRITIDDHCEGQIATEDNFKINFCHMCGRKLED